MYSSIKVPHHEELEVPVMRGETNRNPDRAVDTQNPSLGVPTTSCRLSLIDCVLALACLTCSVLALMAVFYPPIAIRLGQVNQLIALGFLLQLMVLCTQNQFRYLLLLAECLWHKSSLQNFDAITRMDLVVPHTSWPIRLAIAFLFVLPIGLGVSYKNFTGGLTLSSFTSITGTFGITGPPGTLGIGAIGSTLFVNATLPWWTNPGSNATFGFNMYVESPSKTAMLDGPTIDYVSSIQARLRQGDTEVLHSVVNATVAEMVVNIADPNMNSDLAFWYANDTVSSMSPRQATEDLWNWFNTVVRPSDHPVVYSDNVYNTIGNGLMIPHNPTGAIWNNSFIMTSRWNSSIGESFGSVAQGFHLYRQRYAGTWAITASSVSLISAREMTDTDSPRQEDTTLINSNFLQIETYYPSVLAEFDWKHLGNMGAYASNEDDATTIQQQKIKTDTTLVAAMVWSRLSSWNGLTNPYYKAQVQEGVAWPDVEYTSHGTLRRQTETLKQRPLLAVVLTINPFLVFVILIIRVAMLDRAPISRNFGLISLLAGIDNDSKNLLKGASYSGQLKEDIKVKFVVTDVDDGTYDDGNIERCAALRRGGEVTLQLTRMGGENGAASTGPTTRIRKGFVYK